MNVFIGICLIILGKLLALETWKSASENNNCSNNNCLVHCKIIFGSNYKKY